MGEQTNPLAILGNQSAPRWQVDGVMVCGRGFGGFRWIGAVSIEKDGGGVESVGEIVEHARAGSRWSTETAWCEFRNVTGSRKAGQIPTRLVVRMLGRG